MKIILKKLYRLAISIPHDKLLHFIAGGIVTGFIFLASVGFFSLWLAATLSILGSLIVGVLKEVYDKCHPEEHTFDFKDIIATVIGGAFAAVYGMLISMIFIGV